MFFMGNGFMNSDWGMMGGYPSATGYRFEAHETGLDARIAIGDSLPLGGDLDPSHPDYEHHLDATAKIKRDKQCVTTEDCYDNYDLYLNYLRGGPGFGDPIDRDCAAIEADLNQKFLLPDYAEKVYGVVFTKDEAGSFTVDREKSQARRAAMRKERLARAVPTREWMKEERERILNKHASVQVRHMFATSFGLSAKFTDEFKEFWNLPADWTLTEEELDVPTYGSKHRMDLSLLPDVKTVVQVEE